MFVALCGFEELLGNTRAPAKGANPFGNPRKMPDGIFKKSDYICIISYSHGILTLLQYSSQSAPNILESICSSSGENSLEPI